MDEHALRLADERALVAARVCAFVRRWQRARLRLYRQELQTVVRQATPLLRPLAEERAFDPHAALDAIRPPERWPEHSGMPDAHRRRAAKRWTARRFGADVASVTVGSAVAQDGPVLLRLTPFTVEVSCQIGTARIRTEVGLMHLRLADVLPETMLERVLGKPLCALVDHPLFAGRRWIVHAARSSGRGTWLTVRTGLSSFEMPWAGLLRGGGDRRALRRGRGGNEA